MTTRIPRRIDFHTQLFQGLTLRQLFLLAIFVPSGAAIIFARSLPGPWWARVLVGLGIAVVGVAIAFVRLGGNTPEQFLGHFAQYLFRPRLRVWRRGEEPDLPPRGARPARAEPVTIPSVSERTIPIVSLPGLAFDVLVIAALCALTIYLARGGAEELGAWFRRLTG